MVFHSPQFLHVKYPEVTGLRLLLLETGHKAAALLHQLSGNLSNQSLENVLLACQSGGKCSTDTQGKFVFISPGSMNF